MPFPLRDHCFVCYILNVLYISNQFTVFLFRRNLLNIVIEYTSKSVHQSFNHDKEHNIIKIHTDTVVEFMVRAEVLEYYLFYLSPQMFWFFKKRLKTADIAYEQFKSSIGGALSRLRSLMSL